MGGRRNQAILCSMGGDAGNYQERKGIEMSDEVDIASDAEELFRSAQLAHIRALAGIEIKPSRVCLNCGEKTRKGARFCDTDCQSDHERRNKAGFSQNTV